MVISFLLQGNDNLYINQKCIKKINMLIIKFFI